MSGWIKKQKDKFLNLKFIDSKIKEWRQFINYEHFHFVIWFIAMVTILAIVVEKIAGLTLALALLPVYMHVTSLVWIPFRNYITTKEKDRAVENAVALATFNYYSNRIESLIELDGMGDKHGCNLNVADLKSDLRELIFRRCDTSVKEIYQVHRLLNELNPRASNFVDVLTELQANLKEAIKYIQSIEKE